MKTAVIVAIVAATLSIVLVSMFSPTPGTHSVASTEPREPRKPCLSVLESSWDYYLSGGGAGQTGGDGRTDAVIGKARNDCAMTIGSAYVEFTIFDVTGSQIGVAIDSTENLEPGTTWRFKAQVADSAAAWTFKLAKVSAFR